MMNHLRRRLDAAVAHRTDEAVRAYDRRIAEFQASMNARLDDYEARLSGTQADYSFLRSEFDRLAPQLAALEYRFEALRHALDAEGLPEEHALELARLEHERSRIRLELASHYEERLARLEVGASIA